MPMIYIIFKEQKFSIERAEGKPPLNKFSKVPVCTVKTHARDMYLNKGKLRKVAAEFFNVPEASISVL